LYKGDGDGEIGAIQFRQREHRRALLTVARPRTGLAWAGARNLEVEGDRGTAAPRLDKRGR